MAELNPDLQPVLNNVITIMTGSSLSEQFLTDVLKRLESIGYLSKIEDSWMLCFSIQKVESRVKSACNAVSIPVGLNYTAVDMICGEFLFAMKQSGQLTGFNLEAAVKSIQEGDVNVSFAFGSGSMTPEERLDALIGFLMHGDIDFASYRCIKW